MKNEIHVNRFTVLTAILFTALLSACNLDTWAKRCSVAGNEWTTAIHETGDGGFIFADSSDALGSCLLKLDKSGVVQWQKRYGDSDTILSLQKTADRDTIVFGNTGASAAHSYLMKVDGTGAVLWRKEYSPGFGNANTAMSMAPKGGAMFIGGSIQNPAGGQSVVALACIDADGSAVWKKYFSQEGYSLHSLCATSDGGCIVLLSGSSQYLVMKTDALGNSLWSESINFGQISTPSGGSVTHQIGSIAATADNGFIMAGYSTDFYTFDTPWIIKFGADGAREWGKELQDVLKPSAQTASFYQDEFGIETITIQQTADGGYAFMALAQKYSYYDNRMLLFTQMHSRKGWLIKLDTQGGIVWQKTYRDPSKTVGPVWSSAGDYPGNTFIVTTYNTIGLNGFCETSTGAYALVGTLNETSGNEGYTDALVIKTDASGEVAGTGLVIENGEAQTGAFDNMILARLTPPASTAYDLTVTTIPAAAVTEVTFNITTY